MRKFLQRMGRGLKKAYRFVFEAGRSPIASLHAEKRFLVIGLLIFLLLVAAPLTDGLVRWTVGALTFIAYFVFGLAYRFGSCHLQGTWIGYALPRYVHIADGEPHVHLMTVAIRGLTAEIRDTVMSDGKQRYREHAVLCSLDEGLTAVMESSDKNARYLATRVLDFTEEQDGGRRTLQGSYYTDLTVPHFRQDMLRDQGWYKTMSKKVRFAYMTGTTGVMAFVRISTDVLNRTDGTPIEDWATDSGLITTTELEKLKRTFLRDAKALFDNQIEDDSE